MLCVPVVGVDVCALHAVGIVTMTRTNHTLVCVPAIFHEQEGKPSCCAIQSLCYYATCHPHGTHSVANNKLFLPFNAFECHEPICTIVKYLIVMWAGLIVLASSRHGRHGRNFRCACKCGTVMWPLYAKRGRFAGSPLMIGGLCIAFSLLAAAGIAWYIGMLDFNFSREPRRTKSGGSSSDTGALLFCHLVCSDISQWH